MTQDGSSALPQFKKFVSETEVEEKKRQRQEEWERVRKPQDPVEAPHEEPEDNRSLYDRLQEQKNLKQAEHDEKYQLKNQVRGLDDEEAMFLDEVNRQQELAQRQKEKEEEDVLNEYRNSKANLVVTADKAAASKMTSISQAISDNKQKPSQSQLLASAVKRKRSSNPNDDSPKDKEAKLQDCEATTDENRASGDAREDGSAPAAAVVIGVLPGIGVYGDSDAEDSDSSSDSDVDTDLFRRVKVIHAEANH